MYLPKNCPFPFIFTCIARNLPVLKPICDSAVICCISVSTVFPFSKYESYFKSPFFPGTPCLYFPIANFLCPSRLSCTSVLYMASSALCLFLWFNGGYPECRLAKDTSSRSSTSKWEWIRCNLYYMHKNMVIRQKIYSLHWKTSVEKDFSAYIQDTSRRRLTSEDACSDHPVREHSSMAWKVFFKGFSKAAVMELINYSYCAGHRKLEEEVIKK